MKVKVSTSPTQSEFEEVDLTLTTRRGAECFIGRSLDSDLVLDSTDVSRLHGKFFAQGGNYYFSDVGSRNGSTVNGKLAEKDHSYMLKDGDIIRIGDFVLMLEDEMPDSQQAETVVRIINPSVFSNWRQQNASATPQEAQLTNNESVAAIPIAEEISPHEERLEKQEIINRSEQIEQDFEPTFIQPDDIATPARAIESTPETTETNEVEDDIASNVLHETENVAESEHNQAPDTAESTLVQVSDIDDDIASNIFHQTENVAESEHNQAPDTAESTVVQVSDIDDDIANNILHQTENVAESEHNQAPDTAESTVVQASDVDDDIASNILHQTENVAESEHNQAPDTAESTLVQVSDVDDDIASNILHQTENVAESEHNQAPDTAESTLVQVSDIDDDIASNILHQTENVPESEHNEIPDTAESPVVQVSDISEEHDVTDSAEHQEESEIIEAINSDSENVDFDTPSQQVKEELLSEAPILAPELHSEELIATSPEIDVELEELEEPSIEVAKILEEKQIVIVGHDSKKSELIGLVSEYEEFLSYCLTRTWQTFSDDLYKQTGLSVTQEIPPANSGGYQAINSLVNSGEIIAVIFLRDLMMAPQPGQASEEALLRICNINNVLLATNLPTAKAILYYLKNLKD
ncbi:FHA domain-containing protein [Nostoc sp.]|uniref:FHA domain-containing protein n=1 Tax=Nostoc sp. TaxID=1180 RepID=UPI002FFC9436